jgi:hypothetical protein
MGFGSAHGIFVKPQDELSILPCARTLSNVRGFQNGQICCAGQSPLEVEIC